MKIPDMATFNAVSSGCCCGFPVCDENDIKCESLAATSYCADDDYTDAMEAWEAALAVWLLELDLAWDAGLAAWLAEDPERVPEDYPVPHPDPRDPEDYPEPEPTKPAGYDDVDHGCYFPWQQPAGELTDEIPTIYRTHVYIAVNDSWNGDYYQFISNNFGGGVGYEDLFHRTYVANVTTAYEYRNEVAYAGAPCNYTSSGPSIGGGFGSFDWIINEPVDFCSDNIRSYIRTDTFDYGTVPLMLAGCPMPGENFPDSGGFVVGYSLTREFSKTDTLASGITKADLIARGIGKIAEEWPADASPGSCIAATNAIWPIIADGQTVGDPGADPPVPYSWPPCAYDPEDPWETHLESTAAAQATSNKVRYKMGIPFYMQAHRLWVAAHAAWVIAHAAWVTAGSDPGTEPEEPEEPTDPSYYHYYAIQWDVVFFPKAWEVWRVLFLAWQAAVAAHAAWEIAHAAWVTAGSDPETEPVEPAVPADPSDDQPEERPVIIDEDLFWEWTGGETEAEQYEAEWHEIAAPESVGESRIVNRQGKCMQSARTGVPPTPYGETYNADDYPA